MESEKKENRGGYRVGAGRKKGSLGTHNKGTTRTCFQVSCQPEELALIEKMANEQGKSKSKLILDIIFNR